MPDRVAVVGEPETVIQLTIIMKVALQLNQELTLNTWPKKTDVPRSLYTGQYTRPYLAKKARNFYVTQSCVSIIIDLIVSFTFTLMDSDKYKCDKEKMGAI